MKKITTLGCTILLLVLSVSVVSSISTNDSNLESYWDTWLSFNTDENAPGEEGYEPTSTSPVTYSVIEWVDDPSDPAYGYAYGYSSEESSTPNQYDISFSISHSKSVFTGDFGSELEVATPNDLILREVLYSYEVAPEFNVITGFTSSYAKELGPNEFEALPSFTGTQLTVDSDGSNRFLDSQINEGIANGAIPLTQDDTTGVYSWRGDAFLPSFGTFFRSPAFNQFQGTIELKPYMFGEFTPHKKAISSFLQGQYDRISGTYSLQLGDGSVDSLGFELAHHLHEATTIVVEAPSISLEQKLFTDAALTTEYVVGETLNSSVTTLYTQIKITNDGALPYDTSILSNRLLTEVMIDGTVGSNITANSLTSVGELAVGSTMTITATVPVDSTISSLDVTAQSTFAFTKYTPMSVPASEGSTISETRIVDTDQAVVPTHYINSPVETVTPSANGSIPIIVEEAKEVITEKKEDTYIVPNTATK